MVAVDKKSQAKEVSVYRNLRMLSGVILALFLAALDQTILNAAIPKVALELHGLERAPWIVGAYLLFSTLTTPVAGRLADVFGVKRPLIFATLFFASSSVLCGLSRSIEALIFMRAVQGIGGGAMIALSFVAIGDLYSARDRGKYQGLLAAAFIVAALIGPSFGGWLADGGNWPWIFFVNVPVGLTAAVMLGAYFPISSRALAQQGDAIVPGSLLKDRTVVIALTTVFVSGIALFGGSLLLALVLERSMGFSAARSGLVLTALTLVVALASVASGFLLSRFGKYKLLSLVALALMCAGSLLLAGIKPNSPVWQLLLEASLSGVGLGLILPIHAIVIQNVVPGSILGIATSLTQFFRSLGGTIGTIMMTGLMVVVLNDGTWQNAITGAFLAYSVAVGATLILNLFLMEVPLKTASKLLAFLLLCGLSQPSALSATGYEQQCEIGKTLKIPVHRWVNPEKPIKAVIVAIPGLVFTGVAYDAMARHLADQGYIIYSADMRGYGDWLDAKHQFDGDSGVHYTQSKDDLTHLLVALRVEHADKPIYCMGESFGANYAVWQASTDPKLIDGVIASGLSYKIVVNPRPLWVKTFVVGCAHPNRPQNLKPYLEPILSNDKNATKERLDDADAATMLSATNLIKAAITTKICVKPESLAKIPESMPILLIAGQKDMIQKTNRLPEMVKKMGSKQVKLTVLPDKGHLLLEQRTVDPEVADLIVDWLEKQSSGAPVSTASFSGTSGQP